MVVIHKNGVAHYISELDAIGKILLEQYDSKVIDATTVFEAFEREAGLLTSVQSVVSDSLTHILLGNSVVQHLVGVVNHSNERLSKLVLYMRQITRALDEILRDSDELLFIIASYKNAREQKPITKETLKIFLQKSTAMRYAFSNITVASRQAAELTEQETKGIKHKLGVASVRSFENNLLSWLS